MTCVVNLLGIAGRLRFQNRSQGGAGVFGIDIDAAAKNRLVADVGPGQIEAAFNREMSLVFDLLGHDFAEDELFGEILGANDDEVGARRTARARRSSAARTAASFRIAMSSGMRMIFGGHGRARR